MALIDIQRRFRELGRIRMGVQAKTSAGKYPKKLTDWRLTSANRDLLVVAAEVYGGEVTEWAEAPTEGKQWQLLTGTDRLDVLIPPGEPLTQHWEMWSGGGCVRRCNGVAQQTGEPCACPADLAERVELAKQGNACKATTRLSVILPRIPDIGVWRVESHGLNAAVELPGTVDILRHAMDAGGLLAAQLRIDQRTSKKDGETRHFIVPVLELPTVTMAQLQSGEAGNGHAAIEPPRAAIGSGGGASATVHARHPGSLDRPGLAAHTSPGSPPAETSGPSCATCTKPLGTAPVKKQAGAFHHVDCLKAPGAGGELPPTRSDSDATPPASSQSAGAGPSSGAAGCTGEGPVAPGPSSDAGLAASLGGEGEPAPPRQPESRSSSEGSPPGVDLASTTKLSGLFAVLRDSAKAAGLERPYDERERHAWASHVLGRDIASFAHLTTEDVQTLTRQAKAGDLPPVKRDQALPADGALL